MEVPSLSCGHPSCGRQGILGTAQTAVIRVGANESRLQQSQKPEPRERIHRAADVLSHLGLGIGLKERRSVSLAT